MKKQTAVEWIVQAFDLEMFDTFHLEKIKQALEMERQQIIDIDHRLSVIEDYAKGEASDEITKLRKYINETYGK